jgi:hypothetical protein
MQSVFLAAAHSIVPNAAEDEDDVGAEENEHQLREGEAALRRLVGEVVEMKATR